MNAISTIPAPMPLQDMERLATAIAKSNLFGIKTPEQALVLMAIAQAEGRHPVEAARDYDIINGRPAKKAEAMLRDFILAGGKVAWHALTDELADATFTHPQTGEVRIDWDMKRAKTAFGQKDMYAKFPRQMLRSRVVSEGVRTLWPLATSGMYEPGEAADIPAKETPHTGSTIEGEPPPDRRLSQMALAEVDATRKALNDSIPLRPAAAATPRPERRVDPTPYEVPPPKQVDRSQWTDGMWRSWIDAKLRPELDKLTTREEVAALGEKASVKDAIDPKLAPDWVRRDVAEILADYFRSLPEAEPGDDLDEVVIAGEERLAAG
jgi:hypothetical protein